MCIMLAIALSSAPQHAHVDRIEFNHYSSASGDHVFDQLIFYSWSAQRKRFDVRDWRTCKDDSMLPRRTRDGWKVIFYDGDIPREVTTKSLRETWTFRDPELLERDKLAIDQRLPLFGQNGNPSDEPNADSQ